MKTTITFITLFALGLVCGHGQGLEYFFEPFPRESAGLDNNTHSPEILSSNSRFQQVYASSGFSSAFPNGADAILVDQIWFRIDQFAGRTIDGYLTNLQVTLSTTPKGPDSLSPVFDLNQGANAQVVHGPSTTWLRFGYFGPGSTQPVFQFLHLAQPFYYRPSDGNLLLDIQNNGSTIFSTLDAQNILGDSVSSVSGTVGAASGTASTLGIVAGIGGFVVPEPSTYALLGLGLASFALLARRKRRRPANAEERGR